jgi:hypothetical protein
VNGEPFLGHGVLMYIIEGVAFFKEKEGQMEKVGSQGHENQEVRETKKRIYFNNPRRFITPLVEKNGSQLLLSEDSDTMVSQPNSPAFPEKIIKNSGNLCGFYRV